MNVECGFILIFLVKFTGTSTTKLLDETLFYRTHILRTSHEREGTEDIFFSPEIWVSQQCLHQESNCYCVS